MSRTRIRLTIAALGVAGVVGLGFAVPALAQNDNTPTPSPSSPSIETRRTEREAEFAERLAKKLGLDTAKVQDAVKAVREEMQAEARADRLAALKSRLDQAVKDGTLTQQQADAILDAAKSDVLPFGREFGGKHGHWPGGFGRFGPGSPDLPSTPSPTPSASGASA